MAAHGEWRRLQKEAASIAELPVAQLTAMVGNIHRDPKKGEPFTTLQFCLYRDDERSREGLSPEVAAVALALRHEGLAPPLLLTAWREILAGAKAGAKLPAVRALHSDDKAVWVLAPEWEENHCRGGLVLVNGQISGTVALRELDRPLLVHRLQLPERKAVAWLEAGLLLLAAAN